MMSHRTSVIFRSSSILVLWIGAHYALEWLFFVTKPSVLSAAPILDRLLILLAAPSRALLILIPLQLALASLDTLRRRAQVYWLAALIPTFALTIFSVVAIDNFTKTVLGVGIIDTAELVVAAYAVAVLIGMAWMLRRTAHALGENRNERFFLVPAAVVVTAALAGELLLRLGGGAPQPAQRTAAYSRLAHTPNVLLIGLDGTTADHSSAYGYHRRTTPTLERLAARGILFENAFSNAGRTYGSLISLLTGKLPSRTHTLAPPAYLTGTDSVEHLPGILRKAGYTTAMIGMPHYADADDWNMKGAFDEINGRRSPDAEVQADRTEVGERLERHRRDVRERVADRFLHLTGVRRMENEFAFLQQGERSPFFADRRRLRIAQTFIRARHEPWMLHVHLLDTHCCGYNGLPPVRWPDPDPRLGFDDRDDAYFHGDESVAEMLDMLERTGQLDRTLIIVYSDHSYSWDTFSRLPLVFAPPGGIEPKRVAVNVQLVDVAPTILDFIGLEPAQWMVGHTLLEPESIDPSRPIFSLSAVAPTEQPSALHSKFSSVGPPLYGVASAGVVICDHSLELGLTTNHIKLRDVELHTQPCGDGPLDRRALSLLRSHLRANGFPADDSQ